jgi:hypothetical protein
MSPSGSWTKYLLENAEVHLLLQTIVRRTRLAFFGTDPEPKCRFVIAGCFVPYGTGIPSRENSCPYNYRKEGNDCVKQIKLNFKIDEED